MTPYERIKELSSLYNIKISKLEKDINLPVSSISKWKENKIKPSADALTKIADYFKISIDYLLGRTNDPTFDNQSNTTVIHNVPKDVVDIWNKLNDVNRQVARHLLLSVLEGQEAVKTTIKKETIIN